MPLLTESVDSVVAEVAEEKHPLFLGLSGMSGSSSPKVDAELLHSHFNQWQDSVGLKKWTLFPNDQTMINIAFVCAVVRGYYTLQSKPILSKNEYQVILETIRLIENRLGEILDRSSNGETPGVKLRRIISER